MKRWCAKPLLAGSLFLSWLLLSHAQAAEVYELQFSYRGEPVVATVTLFDERPEQNPKFLDQVRALPLDHVAYFDLESEPGRFPSQATEPISEESKLLHQLQTETQVPVVEVRVPKTFLGRMASAFKTVFGNRANLPVPSDRQYALVSMVTKAGGYVAMVITSAKVSVLNAAMLTLAQGTITYFDNLYNYGINKYLDASWEPARTRAREGIVLARRLVYKFVTNHIYKLAESPARWLTGAVQTNVLMSTLMAGVGDVTVANAMFKAYQHDNAKLAKMNFFVSGIGSAIATIDLVSPSYVPAWFSVGAYEFKISGALLIAYYAALYVWVKHSPDSLFRAMSGLEKTLQTLGAPAVKVARWITHPVRRLGQALWPDCDAIYRGMSSARAPEPN